MTEDNLYSLNVFFFNDTATTEIYTLSLHDALPISYAFSQLAATEVDGVTDGNDWFEIGRSEEHTSELQSRLHLVCRLLLEKKKKKKEYTGMPSATDNQTTRDNGVEHKAVSA